MGELDLKELEKVSGGVADNILLYWAYTYVAPGAAKPQWATLATRYCLSEIDKVKQHVDARCDKDGYHRKDLYYRQANQDWVKY